MAVVALALDSLTPSMFQLLQEGQNSRPGVKWVIFVRQAAGSLVGGNTPRQLFFQGPRQADWGPRLRRWLREENLHHRKTPRRECQGGVRLKESDYSRVATAQKAFGRIANLSPFGLGLMFEGSPPFPEGEFVEVAFRDTLGQARQFHAQIRWMRRHPDGRAEVGLQFLAASS
ncbi:MAG: PilZ domain-containing protein [Bdellovibrionaceae bacterium]|nr:PilZ domain-containing protein [Pseudobdellovibrionaceae bacterium]MBX3033503.1 PilZ domain-containing protein [Pseudobdellovibrionaceae bacterium]